MNAAVAEVNLTRAVIRLPIGSRVLAGNLPGVQTGYGGHEPPRETEL